MEGDEAAALVESGMEGGDVAVAAEKLGRAGNGVQVQQGEEAVGAVAAPDGQHPGDGVVGKGGLEVPGPLGVVGGEVAVAVFIIAGGVDHRLEAQGAHRLHGGGKALLRHRGGGADQGDLCPGVEWIGRDHGSPQKRKMAPREA